MCTAAHKNEETKAEAVDLYTHTHTQALTRFNRRNVPEKLNHKTQSFEQSEKPKREV